MGTIYGLRLGGSSSAPCRSNHQYLQRAVDAPATTITETITFTADGIEEMDASYGDALFPANDGELRRQYADLWTAYLQETGCTYTDIGC